MIKKIIWLLVLVFLIISCKKEYLQPRSGIFRGTFEMTETEGEGFEIGDCTLALNDKNKCFSLSVDSSSVLPYLCGGSYLIVDANKMTFTSNYLAPEFGDQNIILDSTFNYTFDDIRFELTRKIGTIVYDYKFIRY
jgi:hypothetical protein